MLNGLIGDPAQFFFRIIALLIGITVHEASHATTALLLGDDTAQRAGRVTLNPLRHLDPVGTILIIIGVFGWGKPTPIAPWRMKVGPRAGAMITSAAGPVSNLLVAIVGAVGFRIVWYLYLGGANVGRLPDLFYAIVLYNLVLCIFNLIPIAPLDGAAVLIGLVPKNMAAGLADLERFGPPVLFLLILLPFVTGGFRQHQSAGRGDFRAGERSGEYPHGVLTRGRNERVPGAVQRLRRPTRPAAAVGGAAAPGDHGHQPGAGGGPVR